MAEKRSPTLEAQRRAEAGKGEGHAEPTIQQRLYHRLNNGKERFRERRKGKAWRAARLRCGRPHAIPGKFSGARVARLQMPASASRGGRKRHRLFLISLYRPFRCAPFNSQQAAQVVGRPRIRGAGQLSERTVICGIILRIIAVRSKN